MMYNEELKQQYINECNAYKTEDTWRKKITNWFSQITPYEEKLNRDAADFSVSEIIEMYKVYLLTASTITLEGIHGYFRRYAAFVREKTHDHSINHYDEITYAMLDTCVNREYGRQKAVLRSDLLKAIGEFDVQCEKALTLGLFEGITLEDFDVVSPQYIDKDKCEVTKANGTKITVSKELIIHLLDAAEEYEYSGQDRKVFLKKDDPRCFKSTNAEGDRMVRYHNTIKRMKMKYGYLWLSIPDLIQCGIVDIMLRVHEEKPDLTIKEIATILTPEIHKRFGNKWKYNNRFELKYGHLFE